MWPRLLREARPGDRIVIENGRYSDLSLKWLGRGAEGKPVRIEAATPGGVEITGGSTPPPGGRMARSERSLLP